MLLGLGTLPKLGDTALGHPCCLGTGLGPRAAPTGQHPRDSPAVPAAPQLVPSQAGAAGGSRGAAAGTCGDRGDSLTPQGSSRGEEEEGAPWLARGHRRA